jgi:hypothetical protein
MPARIRVDGSDTFNKGSEMTASPPLPSTYNPTVVVLTVLMWVAWACALVVADFLGFMMFAFADSPGAAKSAKMMIGPVFVWFGITFVAGIVLLVWRGPWQIALAFILAISPPFLVFAGYNVLK